LQRTRHEVAARDICFVCLEDAEHNETDRIHGQNQPVLACRFYNDVRAPPSDDEREIEKEREIERERERDRKRDREIERQKERERETDRKRSIEVEVEVEREREACLSVSGNVVPSSACTKHEFRS
jgi:hypothetical protein